jgi:hypothetical protein
MSRHALVEASVGKEAEGGCQVLLSVQSFVLQRVELGIGADLEPLAARRLAQGACDAVLGGAIVEDSECRRHVCCDRLKDLIL